MEKEIKTKKCPHCGHENVLSENEKQKCINCQKELNVSVINPTPFIPKRTEIKESKK